MPANHDSRRLRTESGDAAGLAAVPDRTKLHYWKRSLFFLLKGLQEIAMIQCLRISFVCISMMLIAGNCFAASGQITKGIYTSPLHNFTVQVPGGFGLQVQDQGDRNGGSVSFHDDFGSLKSVFYLRLSPATLSIQNEPLKQRDNLERFLNEYALPNLFKRASPDAAVLHAEHIAEIVPGKENAYFAVVELPGASTMFDAKHNRRYDTKRGILVFVHGSFIYMLSSGENPNVLELGKDSIPLKQLIESEKSKLKSFRASMAFP